MVLRVAGCSRWAQRARNESTHATVVAQKHVSDGVARAAQSRRRCAANAVVLGRGSAEGPLSVEVIVEVADEVPVPVIDAKYKCVSAADCRKRVGILPRRAFRSRVGVDTATALAESAGVERHAGPGLLQGGELVEGAVQCQL